VREKHLIEIGGEELLGAARAAEIVAEQAALRRVATLVASGAEPEAVFARVTEEVGRVLGAASAGMVRYDGDARVGIVVGRWRGTHPQGYEVGQIVPLEGPTPVVRVWETGEPARIDAYDDVPGPIAERMRAAGFLSTVAAPIEVEGRLWGSVIVATAGPDPFPEDTAERLVGFAELVALGLASADAFEQLIASRARSSRRGTPRGGTWPATCTTERNSDSSLWASSCTTLSATSTVTRREPSRSSATRSGSSNRRTPSSASWLAASTQSC
jgi:transcriptional regulator with GAF, ATPase, and Fis domain